MLNVICVKCLNKCVIGNVKLYVWSLIFEQQCQMSDFFAGCFAGNDEIKM